MLRNFRSTVYLFNGFMEHNFISQNYDMFPFVVLSFSTFFYRPPYIKHNLRAFYG